MFHTAKLSTLHGFTKGVSVDLSCLYKNDVLEYNSPYMQSDFTCNLGPREISMQQPSIHSYRGGMWIVSFFLSLKKVFIFFS